MLLIRLSEDLQEEKRSIGDQITCDIDYFGFNNSELSLEHIASAYGIWEDCEIQLI